MSASSPETRTIAGREWPIVDGVLQMPGANLRSADLRWAVLTGANLTGANLAGADFAGANLAWANLTGANLAGADLAWANLTGANLAGADFAGANLTGANLAGANLRLAKLPLAYVEIAGSGSRRNWAWVHARGVEVHMGCHTGNRAFPSFEEAKAHYLAKGYDGERRGFVDEVIINLEAAERVCAMRRVKMEAGK